MKDSTDMNKTQISLETYYRNLISKFHDQIGFMIESTAYKQTMNLYQNPLNNNKPFSEQFNEQYLENAKNWSAHFNQLKVGFTKTTGAEGLDKVLKTNT